MGVVTWDAPLTKRRQQFDVDQWVQTQTDRLPKVNINVASDEKGTPSWVCVCVYSRLPFFGVVSKEAKRKPRFLGSPYADTHVPKTSGQINGICPNRRQEDEPQDEGHCKGHSQHPSPGFIEYGHKGGFKLRAKGGVSAKQTKN